MKGEFVFCEPRVAEWVVRQSNGNPCGLSETPICIGIETPEGIIGGIYLSWVTDTNAWVHCAGFVSPGLVRLGLDFAFNQLRLKRLSFLLMDNQTRLLNIAKRLGAELEHAIPWGHAEGDALLLSLWRKEN